MPPKKHLSGIARPKRLDIAVDNQMLRDLEEIGESWNVPRTTAAYWMLRGLIAEARGDRLIVSGDGTSERLARWLVRRFPEEIGS